jgi:hypothetical protein
VKTSHLSWTGTVLVLLAIALGPGSVAAADASSFAQVQRVNSLTFQTGTDTFAPANALGGAIVGSTAQSVLQSSLNSGIANGSISWLFDMSKLTDLSGMNNPMFNVGVLDAMPEEPTGNPAAYNGASDLDWWYAADLADVDSTGAALAQLPATFSNGTFNAGPGAVRLQSSFAGSPWTLTISDARMKAVSGASSAPLESSNGLPPGHLPGENLPPTLTSFGSMTSGQMAGNISAGSLADTRVPSGLTGSTCNNYYTTSNTLLDVLVSGCVAAGILTEVNPTQPDQSDPTAGSGTYHFSVDGNHHVNGCTRDGAATALGQCLAAAAYSGYFHFTTDRVILQQLCTPGSYSSDGSGPCTLAGPGYYVSGTGATTETPCPSGKTSVSPGATACDFFVTTTAAGCAGSSAVIGVATTCSATVSDAITGPLATGAVRWTRPSGGGSLSASSCALAPSGGKAVCSVRYTPAPGSAGTQQLAAAYAGDGGHAASNGRLSLKVIRRSTAIAVSCSPTSIVHSKSTVCTATVADISKGIEVAPKGTVKWSAPAGDGAFNSTSCALISQNGARRCTVSFKTRSTFRGQVTFTAAYAGDANHNGKTGTARATVT